MRDPGLSYWSTPAVIQSEVLDKVSTAFILNSKYGFRGESSLCEKNEESLWVKKAGLRESEESMCEVA